MKKILSIAIALVFVLTMMGMATFTASAETTLIYQFTFENGGDTILVKGGEPIGEIVEWPAGSGNHCLKYTLDSTTHTGAGVHPYIWPQGINGILRGQGMLGAGETYELTIDIACTGETAGSYMYPFLLCNADLDDESYFDKTNFVPSNRFESHTFVLSALVAEPLADHESGGIAFVDEQTLEDGSDMYIDNVTFSKVGTWKTLETGAGCYYRDGTPAEGGLHGNPISVEPPTSSDPGTSSNPDSQDPLPSSPDSQDPGNVTLGDATGDGEIDMKDVLVIRKYIAGISSDLNTEAADVNKDGSVDMKDVLLVRKYIAGLITSFTA